MTASRPSSAGPRFETRGQSVEEGDVFHAISMVDALSLFLIQMGDSERPLPRGRL